MKIASGTKFSFDFIRNSKIIFNQVNIVHGISEFDPIMPCHDGRSFDAVVHVTMGDLLDQL